MAFCFETKRYSHSAFAAPEATENRKNEMNNFFSRSSLVVALILAGLAVRPAAADELPDVLLIATWNVEWFYDDDTSDNRNDLAKKLSAPSRAEYDWKENQIARVISVMQPDIIALQEVENREVIFQLTNHLRDQYKVTYKYAYIDGFDFGTEQDVAFLYKSGLVEYSRFEQTREMSDSDQYYNIGKHLFGRFVWGKGKDQLELVVGTTHFRASPDNEEIRVRQARLLHEWVRPRLEKGENVILLGDFNTEHTTETRDPRTDLGVLMGLEAKDNSDDMTNLNQALPQNLKFTHMGGKQFDLILASQALIDDGKGKDLVFSRIVTRPDLSIQGQPDQDHRDNYYKIPKEERDVSDHYPVMAEFLIK